MYYHANIGKLYVIRFFFNLIPAYVIERLFWERRGISIQEVVYTEIIFAITVVLLEVPTGIIADKWSRKKMIVLSAFLECCMFLILLFATEFWHFVVAIFLAGIARSASSGSETAMLYDSLLENGNELDFEKYLGRLNVCDITSAIIAALCGSLLASQYGFELNYVLSILSMLVALFGAFTLLEPSVHLQADESFQIKKMIITSLHLFQKHAGIRLVLLSGMVIGASLSFVDEYWQLYLNLLEIPVFYFGLLSVALLIVRLPGNFLAHMLKERFRYRTIMLGISAVFATGFVYLSLTKDVTGLAAIFLICAVSGIMEPITTGYLHHRIDSQMRATIDSFQSLGMNTVGIFAGFGFGYYSAKYDIFGGFGFIGFICGVFSLFLFMAWKDDEEYTQ